MEPWSDERLVEYQDGRKSLRDMLKTLDSENAADKEDIKAINSMVREMTFVIKWLETGYMPEKTNREVFYDPDWIGQVDNYAQVDRKIDKELEAKRIAKPINSYRNFE